MYLCMYPSSMNRRQPRPTLFPYTTLFRSQLEAEDEIIRIPHERAAPLQSRTHVPLVPDVEHVVQIHIPEQRRQARPLRRSLFGFEITLAVEDSDMETFADEPHQGLVGDPAAEHLHQHLAVDAVEEGHDVRLHDVVRAPSHDHVVQI